MPTIGELYRLQKGREIRNQETINDALIDAYSSLDPVNRAKYHRSKYPGTPDSDRATMVMEVLLDVTQDLIKSGHKKQAIKLIDKLYEFYKATNSSMSGPTLPYMDTNREGDARLFDKIFGVK